MWLHLRSLYPVSTENYYKIKTINGHFPTNIDPPHLKVIYKHRMKDNRNVCWLRTMQICAAGGKINPAKQPAKMEVK